MRSEPGREFVRRCIPCVSVALLIACGSQRRASDLIEGIPGSRQQTISRGQLGFRWPLNAGTGTLACADDRVILFRSSGVTYVVQGKRRGAADVAPLRIPEPSTPPSDPVKRLTQDARMAAFASIEQCRSKAAASPCVRDVQTRFNLTAEESRRVEVEGQERRWPPLERPLMSLDALIEAGRALCDR
jgi:hypothetical protein